MDLLTIAEAAKQADVSDKTLRRAIESGALVAQPRLHKNKPILITTDELTRYIASRHVSISDVQAPDDNHIQERMAAMQEQIEILARRVQELESLQQHMQELEKIILLQPVPVKDSSIPPGHEVSRHVQTEPKRRTKRTYQNEEPDFSIPDFNAKQKEYKCSTAHQDVKANLTIECYASGEINGLYGLYYRSLFDWDKKNPRGNLKDGQRERGTALLEQLRKRVQDEMTKAEWIEAGTSETGKPLYKKAGYSPSFV